MRAPRQWLQAKLTASLVGGGLALLAAFVVIRMGADVGPGLALAAVVFVGLATLAFLVYPHLAVAATVVLFSLIPTAEVFVWGDVGGVKDLVVLAAAAAAAIVFLAERRQPDRWVLLLAAGVLVLYIANVGRAHDAAWAHGLRLTAEPLLLLLAGLTLPQPQRTLRFALGALIITACLVAAYGIAQQIIGQWTLVSWGYDWNDQVRVIPDGPFRSFGTLDDPFAYAVLLLLGLAAVIFWLRRGLTAWAAGLFIFAGVVLSFVRTAAVILAALAGLALVRQGRTKLVIAAAIATLVAGGLVVAAAGPGATVGSVLEDRIAVWDEAVSDDPVDWVVGRGVGEVGTAAERGRSGLAPAEETPEIDEREFVDSGYLTALADVGLIGLAVLLALFGRLIVLAIRAARLGTDAGWVALALLAALLIDAVTRDSFTGFPTAFLALLLVGVSLAAASEESDPPAPVADQEPATAITRQGD